MSNLGRSTVKQYIVIYFVMVFIMLVLKVLSCCLPEEPIRFHIASSTEKMKEEGLVPNTLYHSIPYDNATDAQVLSVCWLSVGKKSKLLAGVDDVQWGYPNDKGNAVDWLYNVVNYVDGGQAFHVVRHWMGITVPLKILFIFFDYTQIRLIILVVLFCLTFRIMQAVYKDDKNLSIAFGISLIAIDITSAFLTVNSYSMMLLTLIALIYYLNHKELFFTGGGYAFFVIGGLTCYFDLMSSPIMTYLYVAIFLLILNRNIRNLKSCFAFFIKTGVNWLAGYIFTWLAEWGVSSIALRENVFKDALNEMFRMVDGRVVDWMPENEIEKILGAIQINVNMLLTEPFINQTILFLILGLVGILLWYVRKDAEKFYMYFSLIIVGVIPFGWFVAASNQSFIFGNISYRILGATVMVGVYLLLQCYDKARIGLIAAFRKRNEK